MEKYLSIAKELIVTAGNTIREKIKLEDKDIQQKLLPSDLVTVVDREVEEYLIKNLKKEFPTHNFVTEELNYDQIIKSDGSSYTWVIDPIDGTMNFVHGFSRYSISMALLKGKEVMVALILDINNRNLYTAEKGKGAYMNDQPIQCSMTTTMAKGLIAVGFSSNQWHKDNDLPSLLNRFIGKCHGLRITGSSCLDLVEVAKGELDGFWHFQLKPWDIAAGILIVREAGGHVSDLEGNKEVLYAPCIVATNSKIHKEVVEAIIDSKEAVKAV
ncbi:MAG: inositol monophosphatase family protein [Thermotaleaceae bacterium]